MALDLSRAAPTPPPARNSKPATTRRTTGGGTASDVEARINRRTESVTELGGLGAAALLMVGQMADSQAVAMYWPKIASETAQLAESNEQVAKVADWLGMVGPYAGLLTATLPLILQIAVNHDRMPPGVMGTTSKQTLEAQAQANAARAAAQMLEEQNKARAEADAELARAQAAFMEAQNGANAA